MKSKILLLIILLSLSSNVMAWPWTKKEKNDSKAVVTQTVKTAETNLQQATSLVKDLSAELKKAKSENTKLKENLVSASQKLVESETNLEVVQKQADTLKEWGIQKQKEAFDSLEKYTKTVQKYHRLKIVAAIVAGFFGCVLGIWSMRFVPPIYGAYALALPLVGAVIGSGLLWLFL